MPWADILMAFQAGFTGQQYSFILRAQLKRRDGGKLPSHSTKGRRALRRLFHFRIFDFLFPHSRFILSLCRILHAQVAEEGTQAADAELQAVSVETQGAYEERGTGHYKRQKGETKIAACNKVLSRQQSSSI